MGEEAHSPVTHSYVFLAAILQEHHLETLPFNFTASVLFMIKLFYEDPQRGKQRLERDLKFWKNEPEEF